MFRYWFVLGSDSLAPRNAWASARTVPTEFGTPCMNHSDDVIMGAMASQITSLTIVYSTVYSGADQSKHQSSASLAFVWGIHRGPVNSPHKWPVTRKCFHLMTSSLCHSFTGAWDSFPNCFGVRNCNFVNNHLALVSILMIKSGQSFTKLSCRGMCKIVTWPDDYFSRKCSRYKVWVIWW